MNIKVGDIVKTKEKDGNKVIPAAVIKVHNGESVDVLFSDGKYGYRGKGRYEMTNKHIDMQSVLDLIKI